MGRRRKLESFIDNKRYFSKYEKLKEKDEVVYKRISDEQVSLGEIRWFEVTKDGEVLVTVIDKVLKSFQSCYLSDIESSPKKSIVDKLRKKAS